MRKLLLCVAMATVLATGMTIVDAGTAFAVPPPASGTVNCAIAGSGTFHPHLTAAGSSAAEGIKFAGTSGNCTSGAFVTTTGVVATVTGLTLHGVGKLVNPTTGTFANSCTGFNTQDRIAALKVKVVWNSVPAIHNTIVTYTSGTLPFVSPSGIFDEFSAPAGATTTITGSFASSPAALLTLITNVLNTCSSTWGPYAAFTFGAGSSLFFT
jgi:hypothetical protein